MGISKVKSKLLEMEKIGKVSNVRQVFDFLNTLAVPVYRKLVRIREPPVPVSSKMGSFHESKGVGLSWLFDFLQKNTQRKP
jgi:hypothetical protein